MAANGTYRDPVTRPCWEVCTSCGRCEAAKSCSKQRAGECSGRWDQNGKTDPDPRDFCDCRNGLLRWKTQKGELIIAKINRNPYKNAVMGEAETEDERDWNSYVSDMREKLDDPNYEPVEIYNEENS